MDVLLAPVNRIEFKLDRDLVEQNGAMPLPFFGMDKSMAAVCLSSTDTGFECERGAACPFRHIRGDRTIVCKHWLRGLCKKGDQCEFLHEYDMKKMPECYFYSRFNACHNKECPFLHIDPESKVKDCPWYDRGFCRHGPHCRHRHVRRVLCTNYLAGFCPNGWECKHVHPRFELPSIADLTKDQVVKKIPTCHFCGELGHKASTCKKLPEISGEKSRFFRTDMFKHHAESRSNVAYANGAEPPEVLDSKENVENADNGNAAASNNNNNTMPTNNSQSALPHKISKPIEEITCYKCGNKGHYANKCPKGHLAFLSNQRSHK